MTRLHGSAALLGAALLASRCMAAALSCPRLRMVACTKRAGSDKVRSACLASTAAAQLHGVGVSGPYLCKERAAQETQYK